MSDKDFSMWELSSGLPLDGARAHTVSAEFTYNQEYNANAVVLDIGFQPLDDEGEEVGEVKHQLYSLGKKWEPVDEGRGAQHSSGKAQMFNTMSNIGKLVTSYLEAIGGGDASEGLKIMLSDDQGEPNDAGFWEGLDVTLKSVAYLDQQDKERSTIVIGEYHGRVGEEQAEKPAPKQAKKPTVAPKSGNTSAKPAASTKATSAAAATADGEDGWKEHLGRPLFAKLTKMAKAAADHDAFMDAAFADDDVATDDKAWTKATERIIMGYEDDSLFVFARTDG